MEVRDSSFGTARWLKKRDQRMCSNYHATQLLSLGQGAGKEAQTDSETSNPLEAM